jgi:hypothetical protein
LTGQDAPKKEKSGGSGEKETQLVPVEEEEVEELGEVLKGRQL